MGRIYEGETKLNVLQVCEKLGKEITSEQAQVLAKYNIPVTTGNYKRAFAIMVLDGYKHMPSTTEHDMIVKKLAKHLMEKYMKSTSVVDGEDSTFKLLIDNIMEKSGN